MYSQTTVSGGIYTSTTWTKSNSPYIVTGNIVIFPAGTLNIEPGVTVKVNSYKYLEVRGKLFANGSQTDSIIFAHNSSNDTSNYWDGIKIKSTQGAIGEFSYLRISNAKSAISEECCYGNGYLKISNSYFYQNQGCIDGYKGDITTITSCVFIDNSTCATAADKYFLNCTFVNNTYGLYETERINITNCKFTNSINTAIYGGRGLIYNSTITNNNIGLKAFFEGHQIKNSIISNNQVGIIIGNYDGYSPEITNNKICNNSLFNAKVSSDKNVNLFNNCWCSSDSVYIQEKLFDGYNDISLGLINFSFYDSNCGCIQGNIYKFRTECNRITCNGVRNESACFRNSNPDSNDNNSTVTSVNTKYPLAISESQLIVYPNPISEILFLESNFSVNGISELKIYDTYGKLVNSGYVNFINGKSEISLDKITKGVYFLTIVNSKNRYIKRLIKE